MRGNFMKTVLAAPVLLSALLVACDRAEQASAPESTAATKAVEITSETPVELEWRYCDTSLFPTPPPDMPQYPVDADGCRIGARRIQAWPLENGTVEVYFVRGRRSPSTLGLGEAEGYWVAMKSRGCDPEGPQEEGFYRSGDGVNVFVEAAADRKFIPVPQDDVFLSAIEAPEDDSEVVGGFLFLQADDCEPIDPNRVF
jgi:hypothetical protein